MNASPEQARERQIVPADDELATLRGSRAEAQGRYDLLWDDVSGGCATDEGY